MKETGTDEYFQSIVGVTTAVCSQVLSWAVPQVKGVNLSAQWGFLQQNISLSLFSFTALPPGAVGICCLAERKRCREVW